MNLHNTKFQSCRHRLNEWVDALKLADLIFIKVTEMRLKNKMEKFQIKKRKTNPISF